MTEGFSVSTTIEALQFLIPCTFCNEMVVKGHDCPSWRGSLFVEFKLWLNTTTRMLLKRLIPTRNKEKNTKTTIKRPRTKQLLILPFYRLVIHLSSIYLLPRKIYCIRVASTKSPHRTRAGHVLMGLPLLYGAPPRRGESEPSPGGCLPTLRFSSCGQEHSLHYHQVHLNCPQAVRRWMLGFCSSATPLGTSRRGTL